MAVPAKNESARMNLQSIDRSNFEIIMRWLAAKENYQWLDFGGGNQLLQAGALKLMLHRETHCIRAFTLEPDAVPIGVVALSHVSQNFKTAMLWYVLGDKQYSGRGCTTQAVHEILQLGFGTLGLHAVNAWTVAINRASICVLERNNFQPVGRFRQCHYIEGQVCDRLLFDLLASEHRRI
jgi:RimJ/RimL family protein N-acetyltransferase